MKAPGQKSKQPKPPKAPKPRPAPTPYARKDVLPYWGVSYDEASSLLYANPSLRGQFMGYVGERRLEETVLNDKRIEKLRRPVEHDRSDKGDHNFVYKGEVIRVESKSLQTATCRVIDKVCVGKYQCDASDSRIVNFDDGSSLKTACLRVGEFDIVAVNCFEFAGKFQFAYARNHDLTRAKGPRGKKKTPYTEYQKERLIASLQSITWPVQAPYTTDLFALLDDIVRERRK